MHQKKITLERLARIENQIQRDISEIIAFDIQNPRINIITITEVKITLDYSYAKIFFTTFNKDISIKNILDNLSKANNYIRFKLSKKLHIHTLPILNFIYDHSIENAMMISKLIDKALNNNTNN
ncbi:30S ribosome-binding factor RbfA [Candidatus Profftella armatura (Diaphorina cf. continua)]|uniref:Ribosome-binding factor A n=1 Tax=Candidatus Profftella armatura (Diaphorina cf. continua) TaxID=2661583 RepID=A0A7R6W0I9_9PROT|nr:30S ribosome-binding factor RbfA [Candidatus Profftella armatura (Diaphorina cf. continua)]BCG49617.1 30S ribosome-binding factor RbfA [Candidatus Profftella armatura (Diaphorina cf. continua)]